MDQKERTKRTKRRKQQRANAEKGEDEEKEEPEDKIASLVHGAAAASSFPRQQAAASGHTQ